MSDNRKFRVSGHEKFPLREGWISKGILCVSRDNKLFSGVEGADKLGVGTNMVKAIRYYLQTFNLIEESVSKGSKLTPMGQVILKEDLNLEDTFTLWLLHSNLAKNIQDAVIWYLFFNKCNIEEFKEKEIVELLKKELFKLLETDSTKEGVIKDSIDVLLNMYSKNNENIDPEDKINSPMASLGLVKKDKDTYIKQQPDLRKVSEWVILYELSCIFEGGETTKSIDEVADTIGNVYNMSKVTVNGYLDRLENMDYIKVDRTAGLDVIYPINVKSPIDIIKEYYTQHK